MLLILQGVAVQTQRSDLLTGGGDGIQNAGRKVLDIQTVVFHVEADFKALIAFIHHVGQVGKCLLTGHTGTDMDLFHKKYPPWKVDHGSIIARLCRAEKRKNRKTLHGTKPCCTQ